MAAKKKTIKTVTKEPIAPDLLPMEDKLQQYAKQYGKNQETFLFFVEHYRRLNKGKEEKVDEAIELATEQMKSY